MNLPIPKTITLLVPNGFHIQIDPSDLSFKTLQELAAAYTNRDHVQRAKEFSTTKNIDLIDELMVVGVAMSMHPDNPDITT